jgi:hypothetical protein
VNVEDPPLALTTTTGTRRTQRPNRRQRPAGVDMTLRNAGALHYSIRRAHRRKCRECPKHMK